MGERLRVEMTVDTESKRPIWAYGGHAPREMFALIVFRCPSCGSVGKAGTWCEGHSAPLECVGEALRVRREPVLVPHAEPERATTETYDRAKKTALDAAKGEVELGVAGGPPEKGQRGPSSGQVPTPPGSAKLSDAAKGGTDG